MRDAGRIFGAGLALALVTAAAGQALASPGAPASIAPDLPGVSSPELSRATASGSITREQLERRLRRLARQAPSASGFLVREIVGEADRTLFERNDLTRRMLASNTKLFTTATALHRLGGQRRLATRVKRQGRLVGGRRLHGKLFLIGGGDPTLGRAGMRRLARQVWRTGIRRVRGGIVADDTIFDRRRGVPASNWRPSPWIRPLSGLVYGGSTYSGDPARAAAAAFRSALRRRGVRVGGEIRVRGLPERLAGRADIARHRSPTVAELAATINMPSDNFQAEMVLKGIPASAGRKGATRRGARAVGAFAARLGSGIDARDGSGLTRGNAASPSEVVQLLLAMREHRQGDAFYRALPRAGREGTLRKRMRGTPAQGRCRAKTGTLTGVSTLSGYCDRGPRGGGEGVIAFSLLMNGVGSSQAARDLQDRMVVQIARYAG